MRTDAGTFEGCPEAAGRARRCHLPSWDVFSTHTQHPRHLFPHIHLPVVLKPWWPNTQSSQWEVLMPWPSSNLTELQHEWKWYESNENQQSEVFVLVRFIIQYFVYLEPRTVWAPQTVQVRSFFLWKGTKLTEKSDLKKWGRWWGGGTTAINVGLPLNVSAQCYLMLGLFFLYSLDNLFHSTWKLEFQEKGANGKVELPSLKS